MIIDLAFFSHEQHLFITSIPNEYDSLLFDSSPPSELSLEISSAFKAIWWYVYITFEAFLLSLALVNQLPLLCNVFLEVYLQNTLGGSAYLLTSTSCIGDELGR